MPKHKWSRISFLGDTCVNCSTEPSIYTTCVQSSWYISLVSYSESL